MNDTPDLWGDTTAAPREAETEALVVDVDGFEGPLDLLLTLARDQKVDITRISILALVEQYLLFIDKLRERRLEIAADYLVMAAWLAFLKSRLLLPDVSEGEEPTGDELAAELAFRLRRLEAMRSAATQLANSNRLGRDVFARGAPEPIDVTRRNEYATKLYDLLNAYAEQRQRRSASVVHVRLREGWSLQDARDALTPLFAALPDWAPLDRFLVRWCTTPAMARSVRASALGASLELVREGVIEVRQTAAFAPIYLKGTEARQNG